LAERLHVQEHPTRPAISQVWFTLLPLRLFQESSKLFQPGHDAIQIADLAVEASAIIPAWLGAWYDLELILTEGESVIFGTLVYKTDLFAESTAQRMIADFRTLLTRIVANPNLRLDGLTLSEF
jgi:non-ribosomal peptide synthetase component F